VIIGEGGGSYGSVDAEVLVVIVGSGGWAGYCHCQWWMDGSGKKAGDVSVMNNRIWQAAACGPLDVIIRLLMM